jgi:Mg2+/Co2+ transporter CorB
MEPPLPLADPWLSLLGILFWLLVSAFFSAADTALNAAPRAALKSLADKGARGAVAALAVIEDNERMVGTLLLGRIVAKVSAAVLAAGLVLRHALEAGAVLAVLAVTLLVLIFGEVLPKTLAATHPETTALRTAAIVRGLIWLVGPLLALVRGLSDAILRLFGIRIDPNRHILALRAEIAGAIAMGHFEGAVEKEARDRLLGALDLSDRTVDEIMRHRRQIEMIDADLPPDAIITRVLASAHSRLPVFRDNEENILGVVHAKDLLREADRLMRGPEASVAGLDIVKVAMKPYFIPETTALDEQMREFLKRHAHFALVVDEYGALQGLITLEDILEEIVGEITDEFDVEDRSSALKPTASGDYLVDGAATIRDLNRAMDWRLPDDEANTLAGLVIHEAQMIPTEGMAFSFHGFRFEVVQRRENRLTRIKLRPL